MTVAADQDIEGKRDVTLRVFRLNPQVDSKPYYDDYTIPVERGITVLRALNYIKENIDASISYRGFSGQAGICGSCGMRIQRHIQACLHHAGVGDELSKCREEGIIKIEPLRNMPLIKDLIVDMDPLCRQK